MSDDPEEIWRSDRENDLGYECPQCGRIPSFKELDDGMCPCELRGLREVKPRFRVGFESSEVKSIITDRHPDLTPIIDTNTVFAFGRVIALCPDADSAKTVVEMLNRASKETT